MLFHERKEFSMRYCIHRLQMKNEALIRENEKLKQRLNESIDLIQTHLPSRKEFFLWQEGYERKL